MSVFKTKARAIELLGKGQIADYPTAICELWKNAYDAYASQVRVDLYQTSCPGVTTPTLCLWDDGIGMSRADFEELCLIVGTDAKSGNDTLFNPNCPKGVEPRVKMGEKGIGRLSVSFLGAQMLLISKKADSSLACLFINWNILENYDLFLDQLTVPTCEVPSVKALPQAVAQLVSEFAGNLKIGDWTAHSELKNQIESELKSFHFDLYPISWSIC